MVMMYVRFLLSLRNVEDLLFERGIDLCHETARFWWNRFGTMFAGDIRRQRVSRMKGITHWRWHLGGLREDQRRVHYLWRAVDHKGRVLLEQWDSTFPSWLSRFHAGRSPRFVLNLIHFRYCRERSLARAAPPPAGKRTNCWLV